MKEIYKYLIYGFIGGLIGVLISPLIYSCIYSAPYRDVNTATRDVDISFIITTGEDFEDTIEEIKTKIENGDLLVSKNYIIVGIGTSNEKEMAEHLKKYFEENEIENKVLPLQELLGDVSKIKFEEFQQQTEKIRKEIEEALEKEAENS